MTNNDILYLEKHARLYSKASACSATDPEAQLRERGSLHLQEFIGLHTEMFTQDFAYLRPTLGHASEREHPSLSEVIAQCSHHTQNEHFGENKKQNEGLELGLGVEL